MTRPFTPREREILAHRMWPESASRRRPTLARLGTHYGITKERVRQIEESGLRKLAERLGKPYPFAIETYERDWREVELWVTFNLPYPGVLDDVCQPVDASPRL